jgi:glycosyltransferase involved in cell wall biosynthesis
VLSVIEIPDYRIQFAQQRGFNFLYTGLSHRYNRFFFSPSLRKAEVIIAGSNSTKIDLIQKYGVDEKKIRVVYQGPDEQFCVAKDEKDLVNTRNKYNAQTGYFLHISSSDPRDNTQAVIRALQRVKPELRIPKKLIIGGDMDSEKLGFKKLIRELNLENSIIFTGRLSEEELLALYQAADLFIDPSLYEGFGLQVVEAMACGIPVITSNLTSLPEIVGDAAILVNPTDIDSLTSAMVRVLTDSRLQNSMRQKSLERAKLFSWDKAARETLAIYEELL